MGRIFSKTLEFLGLVSLIDLSNPHPPHPYSYSAVFIPFWRRQGSRTSPFPPPQFKDECVRDAWSNLFALLVMETVVYFFRISENQSSPQDITHYTVMCSTAAQLIKGWSGQRSKEFIVWHLVQCLPFMTLWNFSAVLSRFLVRVSQINFDGVFCMNNTLLQHSLSVDFSYNWYSWQRQVLWYTLKILRFQNVQFHPCRLTKYYWTPSN